LCLSCRKITLIHRRLYFEFKRNYIIIPWSTLLIFAINKKLTRLKLGSQSSTGNIVTGIPEKVFFLTVYNKHLFSECNLTAEIEEVQDKMSWLYSIFVRYHEHLYPQIKTCSIVLKELHEIHGLLLRTIRKQLICPTIDWFQ